MPEASNPRVSSLLRAFTWTEVVVVGAAAGLYTAPALVIPFWPWALTPFNAFFVGATYFAAWIPLVIFAVSGRWNPGRLVLPMIGAFTAYVLLISLAGIPTFSWDRPGTYAWWVLYIALPINSVVHLWIYRRWQPAGALPTPAPLRMVLLAQAAVLGLYGIAMFIAPEAVNSWWPWPIDAFNGRMYGANFITLAVGSLVLLRQSSRLELITLGATSLTLGLVVMAGLVKTDAPLHRVDWTAPATILWMALFAVIALLGAWEIVAAQAQRNPAASAEPVQP